MNQQTFDYSKLRGKIREMYDNQRSFALEMEMSHATVSGKLNNKVGWSQNEMLRAAELLRINNNELLFYFFTKEV